jgi:glutathione S-transferase
MFKLYSRRNAGSAAVEALLAEVGAPFDLIDVPRNADKSIPAWFKAINPRGEVPALELPDNSLMTESAAIMIYLADLYPQAGFAPAVSSPLRGRYLRWMTYIATAPYMSVLRMYFSERYSTEAAAADGIRVKAVSDFNADFDIFAQALGAGPFILGDRISAVDIYAAMLLSWSDGMHGLFTRHENLRVLYAGVAAHSKIAAVWTRNDMPLA